MINRYHNSENFVTDISKLTIINTSEIYISGPDDYDIVIDLENRINEFEILKPFISLVTNNICKMDNMVQEYNRLHCRENEFDFDLTVIYFDKPNVIRLDYWGNRINTQFIVVFEFNGNEFVLKSFGKINNIPSDWNKETQSDVSI